MKFPFESVALNASGGAGDGFYVLYDSAVDGPIMGTIQIRALDNEGLIRVEPHDAAFSASPVAETLPRASAGLVGARRVVPGSPETWTFRPGVTSAPTRILGRAAVGANVARFVGVIAAAS